MPQTSRNTGHEGHAPISAQIQGISAAALDDRCRFCVLAGPCRSQNLPCHAAAAVAKRHPTSSAPRPRGIRRRVRVGPCASPRAPASARPRRGRHHRPPERRQWERAVLVGRHGGRPAAHADSTRLASFQELIPGQPTGIDDLVPHPPGAALPQRHRLPPRLHRSPRYFVFCPGRIGRSFIVKYTRLFDR